MAKLREGAQVLKTINLHRTLLGASYPLLGSGYIARRSLVGVGPSIHSSLPQKNGACGFVSTSTMPTNLVPILECYIPHID